ncbi:hypothetical protein LCGC14_0410880 [marine sediment metagenome]|uniref:Uncharacterized protein n=1 Tax=marine sediment metagenome TaxID=412755 RepID=A0A0F9TBS1_9ZZZZ
MSELTELLAIVGAIAVVIIWVTGVIKIIHWITNK